MYTDGINLKRFKYEKITAKENLWVVGKRGMPVGTKLVESFGIVTTKTGVDKKAEIKNIVTLNMKKTKLISREKNLYS